MDQDNRRENPNLDEDMERDTQIRRDTQVRGSLGVPPSGESTRERDRSERPDRTGEIPEFESDRGEERGSER